MFKYHDVAPKPNELAEQTAVAWAQRQDAGHPDANLVLVAMAGLVVERPSPLNGPPWHPKADLKDVARAAGLGIQKVRLHIQQLHDLALAQDFGDGYWRLGTYAHGGDYAHCYRPPYPPVPKAMREEVFRRDADQCLLCSSAEDLTLDHIHPRFWGGQNTLENLRVLCRPCNSSKGAAF